MMLNQVVDLDVLAHPAASVLAVAAAEEGVLVGEMIMMSSMYETDMQLQPRRRQQQLQQHLPVTKPALMMPLI